jgi:hypothetical protein
MKRLKSFIAVTAGVMLLAGCGASFEISESDFSDYANKNSGTLTDVTADYSTDGNVEGVYLLEIDNAQIELWDYDTAENASKWFDDQTEILTDESTSVAGSVTSDGGDYHFTIDGEYYRLLLSGDKGIYSHGDKDAVDSALTSMEIVK